MDARAIDHRKAGIALREYHCEIGPGDQHSLGAIARNECLRELPQLFPLRVGSATRNKIRIEPVDRVDLARVGRDSCLLYTSDAADD